jgi:hypothetical protein
VLRKNSEEIDWVEDLEVAVDLWVEPRAIDDGVFGVFEGDFRLGEWIAQDGLAKALAFSVVLLRNTRSPIGIKSGVFRGLHSRHKAGEMKPSRVSSERSWALKSYFRTRLGIFTPPRQKTNFYQ